MEKEMLTKKNKLHSEFCKAEYALTDKVLRRKRILLLDYFMANWEEATVRNKTGDDMFKEAIKQLNIKGCK